MNKKRLNIPCYDRDRTIVLSRNEDAFRTALLEARNKNKSNILTHASVSSTDLWMAETKNHDVAKKIFKSVNIVYDFSSFKTSNPEIFKDDFFDSYVDICYLEANQFHIEDFIKNPSSWESNHPCGIIAPTTALLPLTKEFGSIHKMYDALFNGYEIQSLILWGPIPSYPLPELPYNKFEYYNGWGEMYEPFNTYDFKLSLGINDHPTDDDYDEDMYGLGECCYSKLPIRNLETIKIKKEDVPKKKEVCQLEDNMIEK